MLATASTLRDFYLPGKELTEIRKRDFAVWFWSGTERGHEVLCLADPLPPTLPALSKAGQGARCARLPLPSANLRAAADAGQVLQPGPGVQRAALGLRAVLVAPGAL